MFRERERGSKGQSKAVGYRGNDLKGKARSETRDGIFFILVWSLFFI